MATNTVELQGFRDWQKQALADLQRFNVLVLHRRAGKTVLAILWLLMEVMASERPRPRGYYLASTYAQAKRIVWDYLLHYGTQLGGKPNIAELKMDFPNGGRVQLLGAEPSSIDHIRGVYSDALVLDETADLSSRLWTEILRPTLADREGKMIAIGTPKGRGNLFHNFYTRAADRDNWHRLLMTCDDTHELPQSEIDEMRRDMSEAEFQQELYCSFNAAIAGAYYAEDINKLYVSEPAQVGRVPYDKQMPVITAWDLGVSDSTCVVFAQVVGSEIRIIDYLEVQGLGLPDIIKMVRDKPYQYGQHIAPHDIRVRELGSGRSRLEIASNLGINFDIAPKQGVMDGIEAVRGQISRMWFDEERCARLLECLVHYRTEYDDKKQVFKETPLHDWSSHAADAMRYLCSTPLRGGDWGGDIDYTELDRMTGWAS